LSAFAGACGFYLPIYPLKGYSITLTPAPDARVIRIAGASRRQARRARALRRAA
jgi:hypothetical protein